MVLLTLTSIQIKLNFNKSYSRKYNIFHHNTTIFSLYNISTFNNKENYDIGFFVFGKNILV